MIRSALRHEFDNNRGSLFVFAALPILLLFSFVVPAPFVPFILPLAVFPLFYYYARRAAVAKAFWAVTVYSVMLFIEIMFISYVDPQFLLSRIGPPPDLVPEFFINRESPENIILGTLADYGYTAILAMLSGGALAFVYWSKAIIIAAANAGAILKTAGPAMAVLSIGPNDLAIGIGQVLISIAVSVWFWNKIEGKPVPSKTGVIAAVFLSLCFVSLSIYLTFTLTPVWESAITKSLM